jgi:integrase
MVRKVQTGAYVEIQPITFKEYAEAWLTGITNLKPSTLGAYTTALRNHLVPVLGGLPLGQIGPEEVNRYLASQEGKQRPKSLTNPLSRLSKILTDAVEAGRLTANRLLRSKAVRRPKAIREDDEITIEVPTHEEVNGILDALPTAWQPFFLTLACTGMRYGEAVALTWADVDDVGGRLWVRRAYYRGAFYLPKTKRSPSGGYR